MKSSGLAALALALSFREETNVDGVHPGERRVENRQKEFIRPTHLLWNPQY
jgi:hypothetical protein